MSLFDLMQEHGYGDIHLCRDDATGLQAIVAIHDTRLGPTLGGCRFIHYDGEEDALRDAVRLARAMTYKAALCGVAHGGGKAVIMKPRGDFHRRGLFERFGRFVESLGGRYITTEDSGTSPEDMGAVRLLTAHVAGFAKDSGGSGDPSPFTALGVRRGIEACVAHALGKGSLKGIRVAVQGVGNVGENLCRELAEQGALLTVADIRQDLAQQVAKRHGGQWVPADEIHRVECDVYAPCALGGAINPESRAQLRCAIVAGAANNQLASDADGRALHDAGILYAPDYAINAGGLINVAEEVAGYNAERAKQRTLDIHTTISVICQRSARDNEPPHQVAGQMVQERLGAAT